MRKYFVCSDVHGFATEMRRDLRKAGFRKNDPEHVLVVLGDIFDRGLEALATYRYIRSIPKERRILVRGNHETLLRELAERGYALSHDEHNGTVGTLYQIAGIDPNWFAEWYANHFMDYGSFYDAQMNPRVEAYEKFNALMDSKKEEVRAKLYENGKLREILDWIASDEWVDYWETPKHVFVHSFIPVRRKREPRASQYESVTEYDPNWRDAGKDAWEDAKWGCPWKQWKDGYFDGELKNGKTLVCGHWHTSDFWNNLDYAEDPSKKLTISENPIYESEAFPGLIGLDACTVMTHKVNVLTLTEEEL